MFLALFLNCVLSFSPLSPLHQINFVFSNAPVQCTQNEECSLTEACIQNVCQHPCDVRNPCAENAICINVNHGSDCSCAQNYHGNGYSGCQLGEFMKHMLVF